ncbi:MAG: helix-hairpin-helix domain-containing protein, partial [Bacteroidales bacterium]
MKAVTNKEIARMLNEVADLLDLKAESPFRIRSYREAARTIAGMSSPVISLAGEKKQIQALPGLGSSMAEKIEEIATTGSLSQLEELHQQIPASLIEIMKLEQLGPRRTRLLHDKLKISTISELEEAARQGRIEKLKGFGKKTSDHILQEIETFGRKGGSKRMKINEAGQIAELLLDYLRPRISDITLAGSLRRGKETVGDIDLIGTCREPEEAMEHFARYEDVERVLSKGDTRSSVKLKAGLQADLRIVKKQSYGAALMYFTGSKAHTVALRKISQEKGFKMNEYGIYQGKKLLASHTEEKMYETLGLEYIEPELREDIGEIEAASQGTLPRLITLEDIRGDLHTHTNATDGRYSLEEMARAAADRGYEYYAVSDHSRKVAMAHGLDPDRLA